MLSKLKSKVFQSVFSRLIALYSGLILLLSLAVFSFIYFSISNELLEKTDEELNDDVFEIEEQLSTMSLDDLQIRLHSEVQTDGIDKVFYMILDSNKRY